jgi:amino acid adenylation domain-containing protein/FkbH-like protein/non-ribosomal peptide synthase protein (TIGR01720 family)
MRNSIRNSPGDFPPDMHRKQESKPEIPGELLITVTANYTAEPIADYLRFWMDRLELRSIRLEFSGYNQIFQELMAPNSQLASNSPGINVLLVRFEDWGRAQGHGRRAEAILSAAREFTEALTEFTKRARRPTILLVCPASRSAAADSELRPMLEEIGDEVRRAVAGLHGISLITADEVKELYPVDILDDPETDRQGHIPFTPAYWAAMGTMLARKVRTLFHPPYKVIVVDADNTLWGGVVGELGADNVQVNDEWRMLQLFLRKQKERGMLLALASKNKEEDVAEVFRRPDMVLRREDFVAWKVNWEPKSRNIVCLAKELELGLDSFIFLDDNPLECAEVAGNCPGVSTLLLPANKKQIPDFLRHVWAFDLDVATATDEKRTELYQQQSERNRFRNAATTFREFIDGLQLQVTIEPPAQAQYERAAQLTQRTNQFNTSGIRRTVTELASLLESGNRSALLIRARDRFGDYGEVGLAVFYVASGNLNVESLLMSCRVLGKGVEHRLLAAIGDEARRVGACNVVIPFKRMDRNQPAENFLNSIGAHIRVDGSFQLSAIEARAVVFNPDGITQEESFGEKPKSQAGYVRRTDFSAIATELSSLAAIMQAESLYMQRRRPELSNAYLRPRNSREASLARIWEQVLYINEVGVTDSFLSLGGKSLQAVSIVSRIMTEFGVQVPLVDMLSDPTIAELSEQISAVRDITGDRRLRKTEVLSLSFAQQRLWFLDQFIPNKAAYNIPVGRRLQGKLDLDVLETALSKVVLRHDVLRSSFGGDEGSTRLIISEVPNVYLQRRYVASESEAIALAEEEARKPFDLTQGPLFRCQAISWSNENHILVLNMHHIVSDGWSIGILLRDLGDSYAAAITGRELSWAPLLTSYGDYASWQRERFTAGDYQNDLVYWKNELLGAPSLLQLPTDRPRPSIMSYMGSTVRSQVSSSVRHALEALAEREKITPFTVLLAVWQTLLHRYSQQEDIVIGIPVAGRTHTSVEDVVGCFVNTLAIRTPVFGDTTFLDHLHIVGGKLVGALAHQQLPFETLVSELRLERDLSRSPLFQVMLVLQDTPDADFTPAGLKGAPSPLHNGGAKFDLVLEVTPVHDGYALALEFNTNLFLRESAGRMLLHFTRLLQEACFSPSMSLASLPMMDKHEVEQMLSFVNDENVSFEEGECLHHWFERSVSSSPDAPALSYEGQVLSYKEVNRRANQIAHYLIAYGVVPDALVGICIDRSPDLVVAILGVLKAGGAYLPIDLSYPKDRLAFMLADSQAQVLLTEKKLLVSLPDHQTRIICLDDSKTILSSQPVSNPVTAVVPESMAYVIYTSGSTGRPKGCIITHRNVVRLMRATERWYGFNEQDVWTLFHSAAFDFSVWEIWGALLYGGRIAIVPFIVSRSPETFYELLAKEQVTVLNQTPSAFRQLIQAENTIGQKKLALRYVIFGGEALEMQNLRPWFDRHGDENPRLVNMYGITETTVHVTYRPLSKDDLASGSVIGVPIPDLKIYILDPHLQPVPIGVPGEMYVAGAGLARGYLNRPELTDQRFIPDHLTGEPGSRLYKTGDLARFMPSRDIEYLGRIDEQVKIRGFRIELGEIESLLCQHEAIRETVVLAREDVPGAKRLVAYLVTDKPTPEVSVLRELLKRKLPDYMVPAAFVFLGKMPLTNNGKVDRKALPVPEQQRPDLARRYMAPRTPAEKILTAIWSEVLRIKQVGVNDNFFELGGDSILSIQIISMGRREGLKLTPKLLFTHQTIAELASVAEVTEEHPSVQEIVAGEVPLTPIQQWFFEMKPDELHHYNQAFLFEVTEGLERTLMDSALKEVSRQHDALRLRFVREAKGWRQFHSTFEAPVPLNWNNLAQLKEPELKRRIETLAASEQGSLDLENGPLWRVTYFNLGPERPGRLLIVVHHLAIDGISWRPLLEDLETAYQQLKVGSGVRLPPKTTSFKAWAERLKEFAGRKSLKNELPYWKTVTTPLETAEVGMPIANQGAVAENTEGSSHTIEVSLGLEETQLLIQQVPAAYNTQINDFLLTALARAWGQCTGNDVLFTNLEGHGRENIFDDVDLSRTVGWFTSIFPVRLELPETGSSWNPGEALKSVKEQLRKIPQRGVGYGILRYLTPDADLVSRPEAPMVFNYLGQFDQVLAGSKMFRMARESSGPWHSPIQRRRYLLEINSLVIDGSLKLWWTYNQSFYSESEVRQLADEFMVALRELILHCQSPKVGGRTPSDFPLAGLNQSELDRLVGNSRDVEDIYPLSPIQRLFYSASPGAAQTAFDQWHCTLRGELNVTAFQEAWRETLRRHSILRSTIHDEGSPEPVQVVHRHVPLPWITEDWRSFPVDQHGVRWSGYLDQDFAKPLTLNEVPVMRFALVRLDRNTYKFLWSIPALLLDGWSWPVVFRDVSRLYEAFSKNKSPQLEIVRPYRDYLEWLQKQSHDEAQEFWRGALAGFREPTPIPGPAPEQNSDGDRYLKNRVQLSTEDTNALQAAARRLHITLNTLVQGAWALLLNRQSGREEVLFGTAFAGRPTELRGVESIVGPFVNNLPIRVAVDKEGTTHDFLRQLHSRLLQLSSFQFTPLMEIQRVSEVPWRHRLFDSLVVFQNYLVDESARHIGGQVEITNFYGPIHTNFPVMLLAEPGAQFQLTLIYDRQVVERKTIERWGHDLVTLLERMPASLEKPVSELQELLSPPFAAERKEKLRFGSQSQNYVPPQTSMERTIADLWQKMFDLERVGIEENFFDLGGHSMLLVEMHSRLRETLKIDFPVVTLFEHPTIRSLARHMDQPAGSAAQVGEGMRDRARRQKQALAEIRNRLKNI